MSYAARLEGTGDMLTLLGGILKIFLPFRATLLGIALLVTLQRIGDLLVPLFGGRIIDAISEHRPLTHVALLIGAAFLLWVCHGNLLPYLLGRLDLACFAYAAPRHLGRESLRLVLAKGTATGDTALQQAVIERGQQALMAFVNSLVRIAVPMALPGIVTLGILLWWFPLLGLVALAGGALDMAVTLRLNRVMRPLYAELQQLDYERQRLHTTIFRQLAGLLAAGRRRETLAGYDDRFAAYAGHGARTGLRYIGFNFGRGVIINCTNLLTWVIGAYYVNVQACSVGYLLASVSWSSYVLGVLAAATDLQKQWLETMPAIRALMAEIGLDGLSKTARAASAASSAPPVAIGSPGGRWRGMLARRRGIAAGRRLATHGLPAESGSTGP
jgi:ABC-type bacteriocin/lantibiotic exporter with double-glycine peptidase domain